MMLSRQDGIDTHLLCLFNLNAVHLCADHTAADTSDVTLFHRRSHKTKIRRLIACRHVPRDAKLEPMRKWGGKLCLLDSSTDCTRSREFWC